MAKKLPLFGREKFLREQEREKERKEKERKKAKAKKRQERAKARQKARLEKQKQKQKKKQSRQKLQDVKINPDKRDLQELKNIVRKMKKRIDSDVRKLIDEAAKTGNVQSPALDKLLNTGCRLSVKGDYEDLYREYLRGKEFLDDETHTLKGYRDFVKGLDDVFTDEFGDDWYEDEEEYYTKEEQESKYWDAFTFCKDKYPHLFEDKMFVSGLINATQDRCINSQMSLQEMIDLIETYCRMYSDMQSRHNNEAHNLY